MQLSNTEKETVVIYNQQEDIARIQTFDPKLIRKFRTYLEAYPQYCKLVRKEDYGLYVFDIKKKKLSINFLGDKKHREMTEEEKEILRERLKKINETRGAKAETEKENT